MRLPSWLTALSLVYPTLKLLEEVGLREMSFEMHSTSEAVQYYLHHCCTPVKRGARGYGAIVEPSDDNVNTTVWEMLTASPRCFLLPGTIPIPIWAYMSQEKEGGPASVRIRYPWLLIEPDDFIKSVMKAYTPALAEKCKARRFYANHITGSCDIGEEVMHEVNHILPHRIVLDNKTAEVDRDLTIQDIPLSEEQRKVWDEIMSWYKAKDWYANRRVPWRRGYLLEGPPGTGKTSFVLAVAKALSIPLFSMDLSSFDNEKFDEAWGYLACQVPNRVILFEDIDGVFQGRKNIGGGRSASKSDGGRGGFLTWDCLLNSLDDGDANDGLLLFVTTNNAHLLDSSLAQISDGEHVVRPGRIDRIVHFGGLTRQQAITVAARLMLSEERGKAVVDTLPDNPTVADVREACVQMALSELWEKK